MAPPAALSAPLYKRLLAITTDRSSSFKERLDALLRLLREALAADVGLLTRIEGERYEIVGVDAPQMPLCVGQRFPLSRTYCEVPVHQRRLVATHHARHDRRWCHHPAYQDFSLEAYVGVPLLIDERLFGTMCFSSRDARPEPFHPEELELVQMAADWVTHELALTQRQERARQEALAAKQSAEAARDHAQRASQSTHAFLANISHELRTPLNGILGMGDLLLSGPLDDRQRSHAELMHQSAQHLLSLINDVLDLSKIESHKIALTPAPFTPHTLLEEVAVLLSPLAYKKDIYLDLCLEANIPERVAGDTLRIRQVLLNLIGNAIKFTEQGGVFVRVSCDYDEHAPAESASPCLWFEIEDTGPGIDERDLERIFLPFEQADASPSRAHQGTGLGLTVARELVRMMGGELTVESQLGHGSRFSFGLPLPVEARPVAPEREVATIFVQTDHDTLRHGIIEACARYGAQPVAASRLADVVFLDVEGEEELTATLSALEAPARARLYALVTPHGGPLPVELEARFDGVLDKPIRHKQLLDALRPEQGGLGLMDTLSVSTQELSMATLSMEFSEVDLEEFNLSEWLLPPQDLALPHVTFPARVAPRSATPPMSAAPPATRAPETILIVEDHPINARVAQEYLARLHHASVHAESGEEALALCRAQRFSLILMDCQMPGMDGYETTRRLRALHDATPIVALTASALPGERRKAHEAGIDDYLVKPLEPAELERVLRRFLAETPSRELFRQRLATHVGLPEHTPDQTQEAAPYPQVINRQVYERFRRTPSDARFMLELIEEFFVDSAQSVTRMVESCEALDYRQLLEGMHKIKGGAGLFGFDAVVAQCRYIEEILQHDEPGAPKLLVEIEELATRLNTVFATMEEHEASR